MSDPEPHSAPGNGPDPDGAPDGHDRARIRTTWRIAGAGALLGLGLALLSGLLGGTGQAGMAIMLLVASLSTAVAALYAVVTLLVDELQHRQTTRRRAFVAGGLFVLTAVLMAMVAGIGG